MKKLSPLAVISLLTFHISVIANPLDAILNPSTHLQPNTLVNTSGSTKLSIQPGMAPKIQSEIAGGTAQVGVIKSRADTLSSKTSESSSVQPDLSAGTSLSSGSCGVTVTPGATIGGVPDGTTTLPPNSAMKFSECSVSIPVGSVKR